MSFDILAISSEINHSTNPLYGRERGALRARDRHAERPFFFLFLFFLFPIRASLQNLFVELITLYRCNTFVSFYDDSSAERISRRAVFLPHRFSKSNRPLLLYRPRGGIIKVGLIRIWTVEWRGLFTRNKTKGCYAALWRTRLRKEGKKLIRGGPDCPGAFGILSKGTAVLLVGTSLFLVVFLLYTTSAPTSSSSSSAHTVWPTSMLP